MNEELNNTTTCTTCQPCCPNVKIDKIEEGMTGKEVADLLYNNFDKLNKSKANKCVERKVRHLLKGENKIFNRTAKNKFVQEVFYVWSKKDVNKQLEDFKETTDLLHDHLVDYTNPHQVTKDQVGLGNVDNTSDEDKPISTATQEALNNLNDKVDNVKAEIDDYTVNGYKISNNPVLDGEDIKLDNYSKVTTDTEIYSTDTATVAFGKLEYKLDKEVQDRIEAIDSEENQRKAADEALQNSIDIVSTDLAEEIETRVENDNKHQQEIENLQTDLNTETAVRESEDEVLSDRIYKEVQDRQNAVAAIYDNLEQEAATRLAADEQLQRNIDEEIANRTESDTNIQNNLNAHINDKTNPHEVTKAQVGLGNVTNDAQVKRSEMGAANGVAQLDSSGLVPASQLPSYVDDVLEYNTLSAFPQVGETGKIYVSKDTNLTYRWSGSQYIEISKSLALGETSSTAYAGDKGKANRDAINSLPTNIVTGFGTATRSATQWSLPTTKVTKSGLNYGSSSAGTTITVPQATSTQAGLMTAEDKSNLDKLNGTGDGSISDLQDQIDTLDNEVVKQIKVGTNAVQNPSNGLITISNATTSSDGIMSKEDKAKLDNLSTGGGSGTVTAVKCGSATAIEPDSNGVVNLIASTPSQDGIMSKEQAQKVNKIIIDGAGGYNFLSNNGEYINPFPQVTQLEALTINNDGILGHIPITQMKDWDITNTEYTAEQLNTKYPNAPIGFQLVQYLNNKVYEKVSTSNTWYTYTITLLN